MKKKLDKFAILGLVSFLLSILLNSSLHLEFLQSVMNIYNGPYYKFIGKFCHLTYSLSIFSSIFFPMLAVIFSGISINRIDKFNLKGKALAIIILVISALSVPFWIFLFSAAQMN